MSSRTYTRNAYESQLNGAISAGATTIVVDSTSGLTDPVRLVIEPESPTKREYIRVDSIAGSNLQSVTRGLDGSAAGAQAHDSGVVIRAVFMHQMLNDLFDDIEALETADSNHFGGTDTSDHPEATTSVRGFMSSADKTKLDGIATGAVADHGALSGLGDIADHPDYLALDGSRQMTGALDMAGDIDFAADNTYDIADAAASLRALYAYEIRDNAGILRWDLDGTLSGASGATFNGNVDLGGGNLTGVSLVDGVDVAAHEGGTGSAHGVATPGVNGFMSSTDKSKLDGIDAGAKADHGDLAGLTDVADHPGYLTLDGTRAMTGDLDPSSDNARDLGNSTNSWRRLYAHFLYDEGGTQRVDLSNMRFTGHVDPNADNTYDLGDATLSWRSLYIADIRDQSGDEILDTSGSFVRLRRSGSDVLTGNGSTEVYMGGVATGSGNDLQISGTQIVQVVSSRRFKKVGEMIDKAGLRAKLAALPVYAFTYTDSPDNTEHIGWMAEDVATVDPRLVNWQDGKPFSIRRHDIQALLA